MRTKNVAPLRGARWTRWLTVPLVALSVCATAALAFAATAAPAKTTYRIIQLSADPFAFGVDINARGQVAFTENPGGGPDFRAKFYDGRTVRDIGTLGGPSAITAALNDLGQVVGQSRISAESQIAHAFRWSEATGMVDLNGPGQEQVESFATDINNKGQVVGTSGFSAFRWSPRTGLQDLGSFDTFSGARAINDAGIVVGFAQDPESSEPAGLPVRWTGPGQILALSNLGSSVSGANDINNAGQIVGNVAFPPEPFGAEHAFLWTREKGLIDLTPGTGSFASRINEKGMVLGTAAPFGGFVWTRETGIIPIGGPDGTVTSANDLNNRGQAVGQIVEQGRAYVWTRAAGIVDLNTRVPGAPADLVLTDAVAISDNGSIVVRANTGLLLLVPQAASSHPPVVGPIKVTGTARINMPVSFSAAFKDADLRDVHKATWSWGDGSKDAGTVSEKNGTGSVSGQHTWRTPGIYTVTLTVTDNSGKSATVSRKVVVCGAGAHVAGEGWFMSPAGAFRAAPDQSGVASFAFLSEAGTKTGQAQGKGTVLFNAPGLNFRSAAIDSLSVHGGKVQYRGRGTVNGKTGYQFMLTATVDTRSGGGKDRVRVRIWHHEPGTRAEAVDYDNRLHSRSLSTGDEGSVVGEGTIGLESS